MHYYFKQRKYFILKVKKKINTLSLPCKQLKYFFYKIKKNYYNIKINNLFRQIN
jgi:hypothetical protein